MVILTNRALFFCICAKYTNKKAISLYKPRYVHIFGMCMEEVIDIVKCYEVGRPDSLVVVIPKEVRELLGVKKGDKFIVRVEGETRIIYEFASKKRKETKQ